ncbi:hypothetical protein ACOME3_001262 [Neoechinorhynchus agilis]
MNDPKAYRMYLSVNKMDKIKIVKEKNVENAYTITILDEDYTMGTLLREEMIKDKKIYFCSCCMPHPLQEKIVIRIQTIGPEYTAKNALECALNLLIKQFSTIEDSMLEELGKQ